MRGVVSELEDRLRPLMLLSLAGDAAAHRQLLTGLAGPLRAYYARRMAMYASSVEDLVQEALVAVHGKRGTYDTARPLLPWVYAIARYRLIDFYRRQRLRLTVPIEAAADAFTDAEERASESARDLEKLLAQLPAKQRQVIADVKLAGYSVAEAAARSGLSESAVKVGVHRGLKRLRALVDRAGGNED